MYYLALLYGEEGEAWEAGSDAYATDVAAYQRFAEQVGDAVVAGEALQPAARGVTVRHDHDGTLVTDGPFAEAGEVVGGLMVLQADDLDDALAIARRIPAAAAGAVEVRPLVEWFEREGDTTPDAPRHVALLHEPPGEADLPGTPAWEEGAAAHARFGREAGPALLAGGALYPADTAMTMRMRGDGMEVTDGPFAETAEVIGGLYVLGAPDVDRAVALAARIPLHDDGAVELRPVMDVGATDVRAPPR